MHISVKTENYYALNYYMHILVNTENYYAVNYYRHISVKTENYYTLNYYMHISVKTRLLAVSESQVTTILLLTGSLNNLRFDQHG